MNRSKAPLAHGVKDQAGRKLDSEDPEHSGSTDVHTLLDEAGAVGGADNTAEPAGANFSHKEDDVQRDETEDSNAAEAHYMGKHRKKPD